MKTLRAILSIVTLTIATSGLSARAGTETSDPVYRRLRQLVQENKIDRTEDLLARMKTDEVFGDSIKSFVLKPKRSDEAHPDIQLDVDGATITIEHGRPADRWILEEKGQFRTIFLPDVNRSNFSAAPKPSAAAGRGRILIPTYPPTAPLRPPVHARDVHAKLTQLLSEIAEEEDLDERRALANRAKQLLRSLRAVLP